MLGKCIHKCAECCSIFFFPWASFCSLPIQFFASFCVLFTGKKRDERDKKKTNEGKEGAMGGGEEKGGLKGRGAQAS